jgi:hypothetical protein
VAVWLSFVLPCDIVVHSGTACIRGVPLHCVQVDAKSMSKVPARPPDSNTTKTHTRLGATFHVRGLSACPGFQETLGINDPVRDEYP